MRKHLPEYAAFCNENPIFKGRLSGVGHLDLAGCLALGITGPPLRATGYDWDLRKKQPYCGYETYDFEVQTWDTMDAYGRFRIRLNEMWESLKIVEQCVARLEKMAGDPVMVADKKIAWPAQLSVGSDGMGNSNEHIKHIMGESMESLIHHFKLVTEGFRVPPGQAYVPVESPRGELGAHVVSDGGTRPFRDPLPRPELHQPAGHARALRGGDGVRRGRRGGEPRPGDGWCGPVIPSPLPELAVPASLSLSKGPVSRRAPPSGARPALGAALRERSAPRQTPDPPGQAPPAHVRRRRPVCGARIAALRSAPDAHPLPPGGRHRDHHVGQQRPLGRTFTVRGGRHEPAGRAAGAGGPGGCARGDERQGGAGRPRAPQDALRRAEPRLRRAAPA